MNRHQFTEAKVSSTERGMDVAIPLETVDDLGFQYLKHGAVTFGEGKAAVTLRIAERATEEATERGARK